MNWKSFTEKAQAKTYVLPSGWDSRAKVAEDLGCSEDAVARIMSPMVKAGTVEMQVFPVFDLITKRIVRTPAYCAKQATASAPVAKVPVDLALLKKLKAAGKSYAEIGLAVGKSDHSVRALLRRAK